MPSVCVLKKLGVTRYLLVAANVNGYCTEGRLIESSILRHNLSAPDFLAQRFHLHKKEFPDQKVLMEAVVFGCCLVLVRRMEEVIYTGPTAANLLRLLFPLMRIGVV